MTIVEQKVALDYRALMRRSKDQLVTLVMRFAGEIEHLQGAARALYGLRDSWTTPSRPGFYWAKWKIADAGTREGDDLTPSDRWEVVEVWENGPPGPEMLRVHVGGVEHGQSLENFYWGPGPLFPPDREAGR